MIRDLDVPGKVTHVFATASGTVIERSVNEGEMVSFSINSYGEGTVVMRIADLNKRMIVKSNITEVDIAKFKLKQQGTSSWTHFPTRSCGEIMKIAPMAITEITPKCSPWRLASMPRESRSNRA